MNEGHSRLELKSEDNTLVVGGEIDAHSAPELQAQFDAWSGEDDRRVDMSGVSFMDSSGLRVLIEAHGKAKDAGARLIIVHPSRSVSRVIEVSGLSDHFDVEAASSEV